MTLQVCRFLNFFGIPNFDQVSHTGMIVPECCKDDDARKWKA